MERVALHAQNRTALRENASRMKLGEGGSLNKISSLGT